MAWSMLIRFCAVSVVPSAFVLSVLQSSVRSALPAGTPVGCRLWRSAVYVSVVDVLVIVTVVFDDDESSSNDCSIRILLSPAPTVVPVWTAKAKVLFDGV